MRILLKKSAQDTKKFLHEKIVKKELPKTLNALNSDILMSVSDPAVRCLSADYIKYFLVKNLNKVMGLDAIVKSMVRAYDVESLRDALSGEAGDLETKLALVSFFSWISDKWCALGKVLTAAGFPGVLCQEGLCFMAQELVNCSKGAVHLLYINNPVMAWLLFHTIKQIEPRAARNIDQLVCEDRDSSDNSAVFNLITSLLPKSSRVRSLEELSKISPPPGITVFTDESSRCYVSDYGPLNSCISFMVTEDIKNGNPTRINIQALAISAAMSLLLINPEHMSGRISELIEGLNFSFAVPVIKKIYE